MPADTGPLTIAGLTVVTSLLPTDLMELLRPTVTTDPRASDAQGSSFSILVSGLAGSVLATISQDVAATSGGVATVAGFGGKRIDTSAPSDADLWIYSSTTASWHHYLLSGDATMANNGIVTVTSSNGVAFGTASALATDTDGTLSADSDARVATQKAVKTYVDGRATGFLTFKGSTDCSGNPNYPAASLGDTYVVTVAGKIGGAAGASVNSGNVYFANTANAGGTQAAVGADWSIIAPSLAGALLSANNLSDLANVTTAQANLGLGNVTNDAQTKASIAPNTAPGAGQLLVGNAGSTAYAPQSLSGDATLASTGVVTLANSGVTAATYGDATHVPQVTVDAKGRVTTASAVAVSGPGMTLLNNYGADPTGTTAVDTAWAGALAATPAGGILAVLPGNYKVAATLYLNKSIVLIGLSSVTWTGTSGSGARFFTSSSATGYSTTIADDTQGSPTYVETGAGWTTAGSGGAPYGFDQMVRYTSTNGATATWKFTSVPAGTYEIYATWQNDVNRCKLAQYQVFDNTTLVSISGGGASTVTYDQTVAPPAAYVGTDAHSTNFNFRCLGRYKITSGTLKVTVTNGDGNILIADAVAVVSQQSVMEIAPLSGGSGVPQGIQIENIILDANSIYPYALVADRWIGGEARKMVCCGATFAGARLGSTTKNAFGFNDGTQLTQFYDCAFDGFHGVLFQGLVPLESYAAYECTFSGTEINFRGGHGLYAFGGDNNSWFRFRAFRASGAGHGIVLGPNNDAASFSSWYFYHVQADGGLVVAAGLGAMGACTDYDQVNGQPNPSIGAGSSFTVR